MRVKVAFPTYRAFTKAGEVLSDPTTWLDAVGSNDIMVIDFYRPVHVGEVLIVRQSGCVVANESPPVSVRALPVPLPQPVFTQPIRPAATVLTASNVVPGARVHLYINNQWLMSVKTLDTTVIFGVPPLANQDRVAARQVVCNQYSTNDLVPAVVTQGRMAVTVQPASVVRGSHTAMTVTAKDADTGAPVTGAAVSINGAMVGLTGQAFTFSPPLGLASANGVVQNSPAYQDSVFTISLTDPPPVQPQTTDVHLNLGGYPLLNGLVTAQDVRWRVIPQWGTKATVNATGDHATVTIPALPAGPAMIQVYLDFTVVADGYFNGQYVHQSAATEGVNAQGQVPSIFDLSQAPMHIIGFYEAVDYDQYGTPHFYAKAFGAQ